MNTREEKTGKTESKRRGKSGRPAAKGRSKAAPAKVAGCGEMDVVTLVDGCGCEPAVVRVASSGSDGCDAAWVVPRAVWTDVCCCSC